MINKSAIAAFSSIFIAAAGSAYADPWVSIYMTDTGGSRLWQTDDPGEALYVWASVTSPNGAVLGVQCPYSPSYTTVTIGQSGIVDGLNYLSNNSSIYFSVDGNTRYLARDVRYMQSSYSMAVPNELIREMASGSSLVVSFGPNRSDRRVFTLRGSHRAINAIDCTRLN